MLTFLPIMSVVYSKYLELELKPCSFPNYLQADVFFLSDVIRHQMYIYKKKMWYDCQ